MADTQASTGYGPSSRWNRLYFDGDDRKYEQWELKFLGYMLLKKLKKTILPPDVSEPNEDVEKQEQAFAEMIQFLDDRSLGLVMREAKDHGRKALAILREHYAGRSKPRIITLYTELTSLMKLASESVTDYIIRAEKITTALRDAGEIVSDGLLVAMVLKGLSDEFSSFVVVTTQNEAQQTDFAKFKMALRNFEDTEKSRSGNDSRSGNENSVMKTSFGGRGGGKGNFGGNYNRANNNSSNFDRKKGNCYSCGYSGHESRTCSYKKQNKLWCNTCKINSHNDRACRKQQKVAAAKENSYDDEHSFSFFTLKEENSSPPDLKEDENSSPPDLKEGENPSPPDLKEDEISSDEKLDKFNSLLVDTGATAHIVTDLSKFNHFDATFKPEHHYIELADGTRANNVALKKGDVSVHLQDRNGQYVETVLENALYVPSYPQDIFSVQAATGKGARVKFEPNSAELQWKDGSKFNIKKTGRLYYLYHLTTAAGENDDSHSTKKKKEKPGRILDLKDWHQIMGHCNKDDLIKTESVVKGMKIKNKQKFDCETCVLGKQARTFNRNPDDRAMSPMEKIHSDLSGEVTPSSREGHKYAMTFIDDYSDVKFIYFLKKKSDAPRALEKFLADTARFGAVKEMRCDNGGEYVSAEFEAILVKNKIAYEKSCPNSPHQNGTAERGWRTLFDMARCFLIESKLPRNLWTYAVMAAAYIRNRCFHQRTQQTPFFLLTKKIPDVSQMHTFGSICYPFQEKTKKLDPRSKKGIFVGYDREMK